LQETVAQIYTYEYHQFNIDYEEDAWAGLPAVKAVTPRTTI